MPAGWVAAGGALLGALSSKGGGGAPVYREDPRITEERFNQIGLDRATQAELQSWARQDRADLRPALLRQAQSASKMQELAAENAQSTMDYKRSRFDPAREQMYDEAFRPEEQLRAGRERAGGDAMAGIQQQMDAQQQMAMRRAAAYGYNPSAGTNINATVGAATAKAGAGNQARRAEGQEQRQQKTAAMGMFSDNPQQNLQAAASMAGNPAGLGVNTMSTSGQFSTLPGLNSASQAGQFGSSQAMSAWNTEQNQPSALGSLGQLGMQYAMMNRNQPVKTGVGADGGMIKYADGGEVGGGLEVLPGVFAEPMGYADGGEVDEGIPAIERHDGAMTRGDGSGGMLQGPGSGISDDIPAETEEGEPLRVANGEFIIPADVVEILGEDFFDNLIARLHTPAAIQRGEPEMM